MFGQTSHPYTLQLAALWCSFVPGLVLVAVTIAAQVERLRRRRRVLS
ncbi:MAG TPA: hypothetical protein VGZ02_05555 [Candidatus Baltobacteraceae bacterium]|jgi:hypothetical protein|nr:hypothetical protein [Candidatus Baltobacteraceae bacterium]